MKGLLQSKADRIAVIIGGLAFTACLLGVGAYFTFGVSSADYEEIDRIAELPDLTAEKLTSIEPNDEYIVTGTLEGNEPQLDNGFVAYYTEVWHVESVRSYAEGRTKLTGTWKVGAIGIPALTITIDGGEVTTAEVPTTYSPSKTNVRFGGDLPELFVPAESGLVATYEGKLLYEGSTRTRGFFDGDQITVHARVNDEGMLRPLRLHAGDRASMIAYMRQQEKIVPTSGIIMMAASVIPLAIVILTIVYAGKQPRTPTSKKKATPLSANLSRLLANPDNNDLFVELCDDYIAAPPKQRTYTRTCVNSNRELVSILEHWHPPFEDENPARYLELKLTSISILDGGPDYRDTLLRLAAEWRAAEEHGIDPRPYFNAAARISNAQGENNAQGLIRQITRKSRRDKLLQDLDRFRT